MIQAGFSIIDITPPKGLSMAGFGARTTPATGAHDPLTVRALCIGDTALVMVDIIGIHHETSARIRKNCCLPDANVVIHATHTHAGPASMPERLGHDPDQEFLKSLEAACVTAIDESAKNQQPATLLCANAGDPDIARNRRHLDGPVDRTLTVMKVLDTDGGIIGVLVNYACHPVVLGADNTLWSADYPHYLRDELSKAYPGARIFFLTGCVGDLNSGHSAQASLSLKASDERSFAAAKAIGRRIAEKVLTASERALGDRASAFDGRVSLSFERREVHDPQVLIKTWEKERKSADSVRAALLDIWINWAIEVAPQPLTPLSARVSVLDWGGLKILGFPGEIFAETALQLRSRFTGECLMLAGFCEDNPGYIPPASEYEFGGYEVDEAHRYYGKPASFSAGSAEQLMREAIKVSGASRG